MRCAGPAPHQLAESRDEKRDKEKEKRLAGSGSGPIESDEAQLPTELPLTLAEPASQSRRLPLTEYPGNCFHWASERDQWLRDARPQERPVRTRKPPRPRRGAATVGSWDWQPPLAVATA
jgi:hypothetical protein